MAERKTKEKGIEREEEGKERAKKSERDRERHSGGTRG